MRQRGERGDWFGFVRSLMLSSLVFLDGAVCSLVSELRLN